MTTHVYKNCENCLAQYAFQGSGYGCNATTNSATHGPQCRIAILDALERIKPTAKRVQIEVQDEALRASILEAQRVQIDEPKTFMGMTIRSVGSSLYDTKTGKAVATAHRVMHAGVEYRVTTYHDGSKPPRIAQDGLQDFKTGVIRPA